MTQTQQITEERKHALRWATVRVLLALRSEYLRTGANALKHWEQLQSRMRAAARMTTTPEEWVTRMQRGLQIPTTSSSLSSAMAALSDEVATLPRPSVWLDLVEREHGYLMAMARLEAEDRKEKRQEDDHGTT